MCRIVGIFDPSFRDDENERKQTLRGMRDALAYGGPDAAGEYFDESCGLALGHRRLSILDLNERSDQPMRSDSHVICFNGEAYNFREVRQSLGYPEGFTTDSDTEVILKGIQRHGIEFVHRLRGMFSFAIWNSSEGKLTICRDRLGVKPLYWYCHDGLFLFASELKAFHEHSKFNSEINQSAVSTFLSFGYIPADQSIYKHVKKLEPGSYLEVGQDLNPKTRSYWTASEVYENPRYKINNENEAAEILDEQLIESVKLRLVADVPVGVFLSGGVDSSLVTAIAQKNCANQLKTFTIGFEDPRYNEAGMAREVAEFLGTDHHEYICSEKDFLTIVPRISEIADEPLGDASIIPTYLVAKFAREQVKVSLSADGGDELFGGYTKYAFTQRAFGKLNLIPLPLRKFIKPILQRGYQNSLLKRLMQMPFAGSYSNVDAKMQKLIRTLDADSYEKLFALSSQYIDQKGLQKINSGNLKSNLLDVRMDPDRKISYLGLLDIMHYLEGDILNKVDRATMAVALEGRDPLLDHRLVEFGFSLPDNLKIRNQTNKYLLRQVLARYVPERLTEKVKYGFAIPIAYWLRRHFAAELKELSEDIEFAQKFSLNKDELSRIISWFLDEKDFYDPMFVWFLFVLYQWHRRWHR